MLDVDSVVSIVDRQGRGRKSRRSNTSCEWRLLINEELDGIGA